MTRTQHIAWVKARALDYVRMGDVPQALASYLSDMGKHPEADPNALVRSLAISLRRDGKLRTPQQMREFIEGTN